MPYTISFEPAGGNIKMKKSLLEQVFFNLINNSIRYNDKPKTLVNISFHETPDFYKFAVSDNGIGIDATKLDNIFDLFTTVSTVAYFGHRGYWIGLSTVKKIVEAYDGSIQVVSAQVGGSTFSFTIRKLQFSAQLICDIGILAK